MTTTASKSTVWDDILSQIRLNHPPLIRGWFSELRLAELAGGVVRVRARNRAQKQYLEQHCRLAFSEAAQAATGRLVSVAFEAADLVDNRSESQTLAFETETDQLQLNPDYRFDHFVTGPCNRLAHAAALAVAEAPGHAYNPFFVYGPVGLGKTHLLQAICHALPEETRDKKCLYISCETFINHFIEAVERGALHQFRYRYRHVGVLVIDDIQFLAERERSQEEFFHTFNALHQSHRQIILSADCSPSEIPSLEERLVSRFNSGLVALLDQPCLETRMAIVRNKARLRCIEVPDDVVRLIAGRVDTNIRELEGALIKIDALQQLRGGPVTVDLARESLGTEPTRSIRIPVIMETVARRFNIKVADLLSKKRSKAVTHPRHICMYLARVLTTQTLEEIGDYFGGRDHSTVLHANRTIARLADEDVRLSALLDEMASEVKNAS
ncbi:MAG: chromosomal replication initiator protein DnaA [Phycisphaerae bacterium]